VLGDLAECPSIGAQSACKLALGNGPRHASTRPDVPTLWALAPVV
jgi:hypothetical protein